ncbi:P-loop containing nucleoside triphosphate hydrolase protein [Coniella lustricola]|uniref:ATP-dependent RNA helicase n=1 Tax=Coniella lustricola TaxID=2025994 RepID=A0A2T3AAC9_9PEZI|nr:P-loop containing nucleoside triphosphate hydrolase protein [Coniella lustricola]
MSLALHRLVVARQTAPRLSLSHASTATFAPLSSSIYSTARLQSTLLTMNGNPADGAPARGPNGPSRKRQNPFPNRNRNRNRRGPPQTTASASSSAPFSTTPNRPVEAAESAAAAQEQSQDAQSSTSFASLVDLNVNRVLVDTIVNDLKLTTMTPVQAKTLPETLAGHDVLAQAKTGTGKTFAFLIPAIQRLVGNGQRSNKPNRDRPISVLVISPTRELALQIAQDAKRLLARFPGYSVEYAVGGLNPKTNYNKIMSGCDVLVATPGRVLDYLGNPDGSFQSRLQNVQTVVLDEADRLMDMGFLPNIRQIVGYLAKGPKAATGRQGMLFSATINERVQQFATDVIDKKWKLVSTIPAGESQTHDHVPQHLIIVPEFSDLIAALVGRLRQELASASDKSTFKSIVFCPTTAQVDFYASIIGQFRDLPPVSGVSSRMSQSKRNSVTDAFRKAKSGILIATDVIARGLDFPNVTHVYQVGLPSEKESYIHRLGRTARAGAEGQGTLVLTSHEAFFPRKALSMIKFVDTPADLSAKDQVLSIARAMDSDKQDKVYRGWLGYYKNHTKTLGWNLTRLVAEGNKLALNGLGCTEIPGLEPKFVGKAGLKGTPGLRIVKPALGAESSGGRQGRPQRGF